MSSSSYESAATSISTVAIVIIVVIVVSAIVSAAAGIWLCVRAKKRRRARLAGFEALQTNNPMAYNPYGNNNQMQGAAPPSPYVSNSPNELGGTRLPSTSEVPNNEVRIERPYDPVVAELGQDEIQQPPRPTPPVQPVQTQMKPMELP